MLNLTKLFCRHEWVCGWITGRVIPFLDTLPNGLMYEDIDLGGEVNFCTKCSLIVPNKKLNK